MQIKHPKPLPALLATLVLSTIPALPNGGGYERGGVENTGTVTGFEPSGTEHVRILDEQLHIWLTPKEAEVEVRYLMRNESKMHVKVRFGFPVEESADWDMYAPIPETKPKKTKPKLKYFRDYRVAVSGKPIKADFESEKEKHDKHFRGIRGWMVSRLSFRPGEQKQVSITFRSAYPESYMGVSEDEHFSAKTFRYRLSTGACWAGTIQSGRIVLHPKETDPAELRIIKPVNRFRKEGGSWVWNFENLEPTLADDIEIEAVPETNEFLRFKEDGEISFHYIQRGNQWFFATRNYSVKASSTLPPQDGQQYKAENIKLEWTDTWSEGAPGPGIGEWLEIRPKVAKPLKALLIWPGYQKTKELFFANARPKEVRITLNGGHSFTAKIPDKIGKFRIPVIGYDKPIKTVKIAFLDVWKGARYEDLCVTQLELIVKLDKKPKVTPAR